MTPAFTLPHCTLPPPPKRPAILDTTLRDGATTLPHPLPPPAQLHLARLLSPHVDVLEIGYPISRTSAQTVRTIAQQVGTIPEAPVMCVLARPTERDLETAWNSINAAAKPRIHTYVSTLHGTLATLRRIEHIVAFARGMGEVQFTAMHGMKTEEDLLFDALQAALGAGACVASVADTDGESGVEDVERVLGKVCGVGVVGVHMHGEEAVAKTVRAVECGVRQVEVTVDGVGAGGMAALQVFGGVGEGVEEVVRGIWKG